MSPIPMDVLNRRARDLEMTRGLHPKAAKKLALEQLQGRAPGTPLLPPAVTLASTEPEPAPASSTELNVMTLAARYMRESHLPLDLALFKADSFMRRVNKAAARRQEKAG